MSGDPKRLIEESLSDDETRALRAGRGMAPPAGMDAAVLAAVLAKLGPLGSGPEGGAGAGSGAVRSAGDAGSAGAGAAGTGGALASGAAAKTVPAGAMIKAFALGGSLTVAVLVGHEVTSSEESAPVQPPEASVVLVAPPPTAVASVHALLSPVLSSAPVATEAPRAPLRGNGGAPPAEVTAEEPPQEVYGARWESAQVARARAQLRAGQPSQALQTLSEIQARVPGGVLGQEREALAIEALAASGQRSEASRRAAAFLDRFPNSPHASRIQTFSP
jgi:hypothetical protein